MSKMEHICEIIETQTGWWCSGCGQYFPEGTDIPWLIDHGYISPTRKQEEQDDHQNQ